MPPVDSVVLDDLHRGPELAQVLHEVKVNES